MIEVSSFRASLIAAAIVIATTGAYAARELDRSQDTQPAAETDPALAFVDPVITGPVSSTYARQRRDAGCDTAQWPHIPRICFPANATEKRGEAAPFR